MHFLPCDYSEKKVVYGKKSLAPDFNIIAYRKGSKIGQIGIFCLLSNV